METKEQSNPVRSFFYFGWTVYLTSFFSFIHLFRVRKTVFRSDFGENFTWSNIGLDFNFMYGQATRFLQSGDGFSVHPPWAMVSHMPFTLFNVNTAYMLFTFMLVALLFFSIYLCLRENKVFLSRQLTLFFSLMLTIIFYHTYPVMFTIERGQFTLLLGFFMAVGLFAISRDFRKTAVMTLVIATQYKIFPAILGSILFIRYGWKSLTAFIAVNILMLFVLGWEGMIKVIENLQWMMVRPANWPGSHSLVSFSHELVRLGHLPENLESIVARASSITVILIFVSAFFWIVFKRKRLAPPVTFSVAEAGLIGMAFGLMSLLPNTSHDYKLPIHIIPFLLMITRNKADFAIPGKLQYVLITALSVSTAFIFLPFFLIKTFGVIASFVIYTVFAFSPKVKTPDIVAKK